MNYNRVQIAGNLTRDPELRYLQNGTAVCRVGVAINREWKDKDGTKKSEVTFVDVDFWSKTAETVSKFLHKGSPIFVEGRLKTDTWEDKQTHEKRSKLGIVAESFQFVGSKAESEGGSASQPASKPASQPPATSAPASAAEPEDDVPF